MRPATISLSGFLLLALALAAPVPAGEPAPPPAPAQAPRRIHLLDLTHLHALDRSKPDQARLAWDTLHLAASLQGLVNRDEPRLFLRFMKETDDFWLAELRRPGNWLAGAEVVRLASLDEALATFRPFVRGGIVLYDERVPATSNLASTIAGVEDRLCLRHDPDPASICAKVLARGPWDVLRLMNPDGSPMFTGRGHIPGTDQPSTGSAKNDAYLWAVARYLDPGRCSAEFLAYYVDAWWLRDPLGTSLDNATLTNHDFFIAERAFFFDLGMWDDEAPVDDRAQKPGTDPATLRRLLAAQYRRSKGGIVHVGGFVPWATKYTDHGRAGGKRGGVDSEWQYARIISAYNGIMDADAIGYAGMANASFYRHHPLRERYPQGPRPTVADLRRRGLIAADGSVAPKLYVVFYVGDYDSAAWLNVHVPKWWRDPARGTIPCAWAFNPNLDRRAPHAMDYARRHATDLDFFISGDCGAGYLNPGMLLAENRPEGLGDGLEAWVRHNERAFRRYDLTVTGFIIDGHAPGMGRRGLDAYQRFSPGGIVGQKLPADQGLHRDAMPFVRMRIDLDGQPAAAGATVAAMARPGQVVFAPVRTILKSPTWHKRTMDRAAELAGRDRIEFLDPDTFFLLLKEHERGRQRPRRP